MKIVKRDGRTFVEVEIPKGEYCINCGFMVRGNDNYCAFVNAGYLNIASLLVEGGIKKIKDCPYRRG